MRKMLPFLLAALLALALLPAARCVAGEARAARCLLILDARADQGAPVTDAQLRAAELIAALLYGQGDWVVSLAVAGEEETAAQPEGRVLGPYATYADAQFALASLPDLAADGESLPGPQSLLAAAQDAGGYERVILIRARAAAPQPEEGPFEAYVAGEGEPDLEALLKEFAAASSLTVARLAPEPEGDSPRYDLAAAPLWPASTRLALLLDAGAPLSQAEGAQSVVLAGAGFTLLRIDPLAGDALYAADAGDAALYAIGRGTYALSANLLSAPSESGAFHVDGEILLTARLVSGEFPVAGEAVTCALVTAGSDAPLQSAAPVASAEIGGEYAFSLRPEALGEYEALFEAPALGVSARLPLTVGDAPTLLARWPYEAGVSLAWNWLLGDSERLEIALDECFSDADDPLTYELSAVREGGAAKAALEGSRLIAVAAGTGCDVYRVVASAPNGRTSASALLVIWTERGRALRIAVAAAVVLLMVMMALLIWLGMRASAKRLKARQSRENLRLAGEGDPNPEEKRTR